jgi:hypothetical protein
VLLWSLNVLTPHHLRAAAKVLLVLYFGHGFKEKQE